LRLSRRPLRRGAFRYGSFRGGRRRTEIKDGYGRQGRGARVWSFRPAPQLLVPIRLRINRISEKLSLIKDDYSKTYYRRNVCIAQIVKGHEHSHRNPAPIGQANPSREERKSGHSVADLLHHHLFTVEWRRIWLRFSEAGEPEIRRIARTASRLLPNLTSAGRPAEIIRYT
jgi:hypothetical protein